MNDQITEFLELLRLEARVAVDVDAPATENGEWWVDLEVDGMRTNISWQHSPGFGIYSTDPTYGERPREIYREPAPASARILQLAAQWRKQEKVHAMRLRELRHLVGATQLGVANSLGTDQARVSRIENGLDMKLSALISYLDAIGGTLELKAHFPTFEASIEPVDFSQIRRRSKHAA